MDTADLAAHAPTRAALFAVLTEHGIPVTSMATTGVYARPGAETSVLITAQTSAGSLDFVVTDAALQPSSRVVTATAHGAAYATWLHPFDPFLEGLERALDAAWVADALGIDVEALELIVYRPLRRAVVRVTGSAEVYLKVVRPSRVHRVLDAARALGDATPQVRELGCGVIAMEAAPGEPLICMVAEPTVTAHSVDAVVSEAISRLPAAVTNLAASPSWVSRRDVYAQHAISRGMNREHVERVVSVDLMPSLTMQPTHGDLHLTNLRFAAVDGLPRFASFIDIETAGPGTQSDDLACMIAHVAALAALDPDAYAHTRALADDLVALWSPRAPGVASRAAAVLLSLAATNDDLEVGTAWLATAARLASGTSVRELSPTSPSSLAIDSNSLSTGP